MDSESIINTTALGQLKGLGAYDGDGASYAGQGGSQYVNGRDKTYGTFNQMPDASDMHVDQMGSGGTPDKRGGGVVVIITNTGSINGDIYANGDPVSTKLTETYHAGSGGYIYISCLLTSCEVTNKVQANGGYGSDDKVSNGGSGGRIVFNNILINPESYSAYGGCSNNPLAITYNGAAGTVYFNDTGTLIIKHTYK